MSEKICFFCGHRKIYVPNLSEKVERIVIDLIRNQNIRTFYSGNMGEFDNLCEEVIRKLKRQYSDIKIFWIAPYFTQKMNKFNREQGIIYDGIIIPNLGMVYYKQAIIKRNQWMVDNADTVICYIEHEYGGAYNTMKYAKKGNIKIYDVLL